MAKCPICDGKGILHDWIQEPCSYCGRTGELPDDFTEMMKLKNCKKCGGKAVFSGVFDDPTTFRFPECIKCGARAEGNSVKDSWYERARKWNEQNTQTNDEWRKTCSTEEFAEFLNLIIRVGPYENEPKDFWEHVYGRGGEHGAKSIVTWLKQPHTPKE